MDARLSQLLLRVVETYRQALADNADVRAWLSERKFSSASLLERFKVGWSAGTLSSMARGPVLEDLKLLGVLATDGSERFQGSVVIPAFDGSGAVAQLAAYAPDGALSWLFADETPVFWNGPCLGASREILVAPDPLAGLVQIAAGREGVIAPAGPGLPLGQEARDQLLAHAPRLTLLGCDALRPELEKLGALLEPSKGAPRDTLVAQDANGFTVEFPRRLRFVVQGLSQDSPRHLRASLKVFRKPVDGAPPRFHLDTLDLFHARSRSAFARTAACLLGEDPTLMEDYAARLISLAEEFLREREKGTPAVLVTESEKAEALEMLRDPAYPESMAGDLGRLGHVGEEANKLVAYLASLSRKLDDPLSVLVVSRSAAGKSTLAEAVSALAPPEEVLRFTRLTAQTLYYQKPDALAHKLVLIEEEEGVADAAYALRILQSARKLSLSTAAGKGDARTREVRGPVALFVTTTRTDLDEETAGRFVTLSVDESREQTRAILAAQREAEARIPGEGEKLLRLHQNAQRLLVPLKVLNPYAPQLTFPEDRLSARRDHRKYLGLIRVIAFSRQHQRPRVDGAVEVAPQDIALANRLAHHTLGQSLDDLAPPSRRLLVELREWLAARAAKEAVDLANLRFSQRELRERVGWKKTQLAHHVRELLEAEYLVAHVTGPGRRTRYALDWDGKGQDGERFHRGLVDPTTLHRSGSAPGQVRPSSGSRKMRPRGPRAANTAESALSDRSSGERSS